MPFELGRPFGPPGDSAFQLEVLRAVLGLLERKSGPVLEDFGREAPSIDSSGEAWSCTLPLPPGAATTDTAQALRQRLRNEVRALRPWYDEALRRNGRTGFGLSGLTADSTEAMADTLATVAIGGEGVPRRDSGSIRASLREGARGYPPRKRSPDVGTYRVFAKPRRLGGGF